MYRLSSVVFAAMLLSGCTWVQLTAQGQSVSLLNQDQAGWCTRVGTTTSSTRSRVLVQRGGEKIQEELVILARNEAGVMGGNAIVAASTIEGGRQQFIVYNCP